MNIQKFTQKSVESLQSAQACAAEYGNQEIGQLHLLLALLTQQEGLIPELVRKSGGSLDDLKNSTLSAIEKLPKVSGNVNRYVSAELEKTLCEKYEIASGYDRLYYAEEEGKQVGWYTLHQIDGRAVITRIEVTGCENYAKMNRDQCFVAELMVRSSLAYAMNHFLEKIACTEEKMYPYLKALHFTPDENGTMESTVVAMLHTCKDCH